MADVKKLRVGAYCRVSTSQEDQRNSLHNQRRYFEEYICGQPDWELVEIYADEGLSGTSSRNRPAFCRMLAAAQAGEIDLILTKEVSRFARNTVDALAHTRHLQQQGVGVIFINDHIDTRQNDGEFRLTIMASVAQEESRKISERVKWGQKRSMEHGVVFGCNHIYGFALQDGMLTVKPDEAEVVRLVYHKFLCEDKGTYVIARELTQQGIKAPRAKDKPWSSTMVLRLLRNEKYCGDLLQKKTFTPNYLDHKKQKNQGQEEQIYLQAHHEAIISREIYEQVQQKLEQRAASRAQKQGGPERYWCSGKIFCAACGSTFVHRKRQRKSGETYHYWACAARVRYGLPKEDVQRGRVGCDMPAIAHEMLGRDMAFVIEQLKLNKDRLIREIFMLLGVKHDKSHATLERLQHMQQRLEQKQEEALQAWIEHRITRETMEELNRCCDEQLCSIDKQIAAIGAVGDRPDGGADSLWTFLQNQALQSEPVYRELLERIQVSEQGIEVRLRGLPITFRLLHSAAEEVVCTVISDMQINAADD